MQRTRCVFAIPRVAQLCQSHQALHCCQTKKEGVSIILAHPLWLFTLAYLTTTFLTVPSLMRTMFRPHCMLLV